MEDPHGRRAAICATPLRPNCLLEIERGDAAEQASQVRELMPQMCRLVRRAAPQARPGSASSASDPTSTCMPAPEAKSKVPARSAFQATIESGFSICSCLGREVLVRAPRA
ncbi:MAG TPA: hypothetical protein VHN18_13935 [Micromonosporaceae bacterium]|nr:hypothetical protein [Micromonosporaceae bacterium]